MGSGINYWDGPPSALREIFAMKERVEINNEEYLDMTAISSSDNLYKMIPMKYRELPVVIFSYCERRINNQIGIDNDISKNLNEWIMYTLEATRENESDLSYFSWAKKRCSEKKIESAIQKFERAIEIFSHINYNRTQFEVAMRAYQIDMKERWENSFSRKSANTSLQTKQLR